MTALPEGFKRSTPTSTIMYYLAEKKTPEFIRELLISIIILSSFVCYLMKLPWQIKYTGSAKAFEAIRRWYLFKIKR